MVIVDCGQHSFKAGEIGETPKVIKLQKSFRESLVDEAFWDSVIGQASRDQLIVSLPISTVRSAREELCEFLFEKQLARNSNGKTSSVAPSVCILSSTFLATLGAGLSTALVIDVGETETRVTPVEEGYPLQHCSAHGRIGGAALTQSMSEMLQEQRQSSAESAKEGSAWVAQDFNAELRRLKTLSMSASVSEKGFMCGELLFDGSGGDTLPELVMTSLRLQSNINLRGKLLANMLLVGGTCQLPGLSTRLLKEVRAQSQWVAPGQGLDMVQVVQVYGTSTESAESTESAGSAVPPAVLPWRGGSLLAKCEAVNDLAITRAAYERYGPQVVHQAFL